MSELTLYAESSWVSPWVFHAMVALEELQLPYRLEVVPMPIPAAQRASLEQRAVIGKVPLLVHGDLWITESLAISEYLAERFPPPGHARLLPEGLAERARARQLMSMLRTGQSALREDRPTSTVFGRPSHRPFSERGRAEANDLVRIANALIAPGRGHLFGTWCIADADLSLALMRLIANEDPVPEHLVTYALAQWDRRSVRRFIAHLPTTS